MRCDFCNKERRALISWYEYKYICGTCVKAQFEARQNRLDNIRKHQVDLHAWVDKQNVTVDECDDPKIMKKFSLQQALTLVNISQELE